MPDWKPEIRRRLAGLRLSPTRAAAIVEELAQHLDTPRVRQVRRASKLTEDVRRQLTSRIALHYLLPEQTEAILRHALVEEVTDEMV